MILSLSIVILGIILALSYKKNHNLIRINVVFSIMWCLCLGLSSLGLYGIYKPDSVVYFLSFITIVTFNLIYFVTGKRRVKSLREHKGQKDHNIIKIKGDVYFGFLYLCNIAAYLYSLPFIPRSIRLIRSYGFSRLRDYAFMSSSLLATTRQLLAFQWIIGPLFVTTMLIAAVLFSQKRGKRILALFTAVDVALYTLLFGGRYMLVKLLFFFIISFFIVYQGSFVRIVKMRKVLFMSSMVLLIVIFILTRKRGFSNKGFLGNILIYYTGSFTYFSEIIKSKPWEGHLLWGTAVFGFVVNLLLAVITVCLGVDFNGSNQVITSITQYYLKIADTISYNSMTTMLFPFLMDFGYFGVVTGTALFAFAAGRIEDCFYDKPTVFSLSLYVFLMFAVFDSVMSYTFLSPGTGVTLLFLYFLTNKDNKKRFHKIMK